MTVQCHIYIIANYNKQEIAAVFTWKAAIISHGEISQDDARSKRPWATRRRRGRGLTRAGSKISYRRRASIKASGTNTLMSILPACSSRRNERNECEREGRTVSERLLEMKKMNAKNTEAEEALCLVHAFSLSGFYCWNEWNFSAFFYPLFSFINRKTGHDFFWSKDLLVEVAVQ